MKKGLKIALIVFFGLIIFIVVGAQIVINSRLVTNTIEKIASEYIDGSLNSGKLRIYLWRHFPKVQLKWENASVVYPHSRFGQFGTFEGNGAEADTLASFEKLSASVNAIRALKGDIIIDELQFDGLRLYARQFSRTQANWQVIKLAESSEESPDSSSTFLRNVQLDTLCVNDLRIAYSSAPDSLSAILSLPKLRLSAAARLDTLCIERSYLELLAGLQFDHPQLKLVNSSLSLVAQALMPDPKKLDIDLDQLSLLAPGLKLQLQAKVADFLTNNPKYKLKADLDAALARLEEIVPDISESIKIDGDLSVSLDAKTSQSEIDSYRFDKSLIYGNLSSEGLKIEMPSDTLKADLFKTNLSLSADPDGLVFEAAFDSLYFHKGDDLNSRVRKLAASARVLKEEGLPRIALGASGKMAFVKMGANRLGISDIGIDLSAKKKAKRVRNMPSDSAAVAHRDRTFRQRLELKDDFDNGRLFISLDSSLVNYFREWSPSGNIDLGRGFFASRQLPLRTRLSGVSARFDERDVIIDSLAVASGSSDLRVQGKLRGLWRAMSRKSRIQGDIKIDSKRLNINELLAALEVGKAAKGESAVEEENDESFITDSLENAQLEAGVPLIVVPATLNLGVALHADRVDFASFKVAPLNTGIRIQDRTIQLTDTDVYTNVGKIYLNAFYSTKSKDDISAGVDLRLSEMSAHDLIALVPSVEDMMPAIKSFHGLLGCEVSGTAQLDTAMNVVMPSVDGLVRITGHNLEVKDAGDLKRITRLLLFKDKNIGHIDNLRVDALIRDNTVEVFPFELSVDRYSFALRGTQNLDGTMYYHASVLRSPLLIPFGLNIYGTLDNWRFSLCRAKYRSGKVSVYKEQIDTVQLNFAHSVHNIFKRGVDNVMRYNASSVSGFDLDDPKASEQMSVEDQYAIEDMLMAQELRAQEEAIEAEVEKVLQASAIDSAMLLKEYQDSISDKKIKRKIEKLKRESESKKKKKA